MVKKKLFIILTMLFLIQYVVPRYVFAESLYVLPYPSFMPGSTLYVFHGVLEKFEKYWYFGNFSQFIYNLKFADKYLVEAKTLFEYKQYLLAHQALKKSDEYFIASYRFLGKAKADGKNIAEKEQILKEASLKHQEVLKQVKNEVPERFVWQPEKAKPTSLLLWDKIDKAIEVRKSCT